MSNLVKKAVIPVAGLGTRMLPATKAIPKEMLPIVDKPMIQYIVEECALAGINEIVLVTHSSKNAIENHFDTCFELETILEKRVKRQMLDEVQNICPKTVTIMHVRQGYAKGLGHAIQCAYPVVGDAPFAVVLPDVLVDYAHYNPQQDNLAAMINRFEASGCSQVMVEEVAANQVENYGIVNLGGKTIKAGEPLAIQSMVEKPSIEAAPSNLAIVGRYVFSANIWQCFSKVPLGVGDEIQLTDAIAMLMQNEAVEASLITGRSHDCGSKRGYLATNLLYSLRCPQYKDELMGLLAKESE